MRRRGEYCILPTAVVRENLLRDTGANRLTSKHVDATQGSWLINVVVSEIGGTVYKRAIFTSTQEAVMNALQVEIKKSDQAKLYHVSQL